MERNQNKEDSKTEQQQIQKRYTHTHKIRHSIDEYEEKKKMGTFLKHKARENRIGKREWKTLYLLLLWSKLQVSS